MCSYNETKFNPSLHCGPLLAPLNGGNIESVKCWLNPLKLLDLSQVLLR